MEAYLVQFVTILSTVLYIALLIRVFSSWLNVGPTSPLFPILNIVYQVTEPILAPIRRVLPKLGMLDLSPMVALLLLTFIRSAFVRIITG
ncbi:MAG TPA: YggT family protein [Dehalococcoidia bacterium]|nr:YggT family protein [SAR202 cluster bacterium]HAC19532.1 YggT family protein [Dehalococcoidia bacterium]HBJ31533.1 YggT family protein [Dehalococcoidia bacterium]